MDETNLFRKIVAHPLIIPLYFPSILFSIAEGLLIPTLPLYAGELGFSYGMIGLVLAGESLGMLATDLPSGLLLRRLGEKNAMVLGFSLMTFSTFALFWARSVPFFLACRVLAGVGVSFYNVSRLTYIANEVAVISRGKVNAALGGFKRIGAFIGPLMGGTIAMIYGLQAPFLIFIVICVATLITIAVYVSSSPVEKVSEGSPVIGTAQITTMVRSHARILGTAGAGNFLVLMIRSAPAVIIPLYGANLLGLDVKSIGFIVGISAAIDMLLFYPAGYVMDHYGRKYAVISSMLVFAGGLAAIPLARDFWSLLFVGILIGFGNGLGSGTMLTLGADFSPMESRGEFLGLWLFIGNMGAATGPLIVGTVATIFILQATTWVFSGSSLLAALIFATLVPETLNKFQRTTQPAE